MHTFQFNAPLSADAVMTTDVTISDDQDLEPCEDFTVTLTSSSERAAISGASSRRVVVYDDEGWYLQLHDVGNLVSVYVC